ncbi:hypothetical protein [Halobacillus campisalis]|uniref:Uncharacterized protein n=1 Tax=Halobacillus campisalis TaxID=435909 RepID=A0ABW2JZ91_9BACI|nr:hypothetical protein [Halobacillus campisalis]
MLIEWAVSITVGIIIFLFIGRFTGSEEFGGVNKSDDERSQYIKQKAIVGSWTFLLIVFFMNIVFNFLDLRTGFLKNAPFNHPELFYLLLLVGSYVVYYLIYSRRLSGNAK